MRLLSVFIIIFSLSCRKDQPAAQTTTPANRYVNLSHLDRLYQTVKLPNGADVGTVAIYSEAPDYRLVTDADEGFTCVDDVSRAAILLVNEPDLATNADKQTKLRQMTEFVLQLQAENGYFYNFLWPDRTINKTFKTSVAEPNFWSWRAFWHLTEVQPYFQKTDPALATRIEQANQRLLTAMLRDFGGKPRDFTFIRGVSVPKWLPFGSGSDQAAVMLLGLLNRYQQTPSAEGLRLMEQLAEGILAMQFGDANQFPHSAFLSFENNWHAYASDQAYALLRAGKVLNKPAWQAAARREIDNFYPYLIQRNYLESFAVEQSGSAVKLLNESQFSQIAYGIRPMIWATLEAYDQTKEPRYADLAAQLAGWFMGKNPASTPMYDRTTGRGYDGIGPNGVVNRNSGAESTIESLWAFQRLGTYPEVMKKVE
ncbi:hypothetical protein [Spirosoma montaniterrae]|uniref:Uncharacterized protein n=1 Tax=Spirosoma montaniterrae TaxID=1178516 RepID=A0A1P9WY06_9BACT|nr:hypothetical protein [Spirosoma montaniterrae]AQG80255.1 hypothetical protein AWR27_13570 [Spirosoma montaniterrae]